MTEQPEPTRRDCVHRSPGHRSRRQRSTRAALVIAVAAMTGLAGAPAAEAKDPTGPWNLQLRSNGPGTRSISVQNWSTGGPKLCFAAGSGHWRDTRQTIYAVQLVSVLAYAEPNCPVGGRLTAGTADWLVSPKSDGFINYWRTIG